MDPLFSSCGALSGTPRDVAVTASRQRCGPTPHASVAPHEISSRLFEIWHHDSECLDRWSVSQIFWNKTGGLARADVPSFGDN